MDNNYFSNNNEQQPQHERKGLAIASIITGIISVPMVCLSYPAIIFGLMGLLFGIFSKGNSNKRSGVAIAGIITGAIGLVLGLIITIVALVYLKNNPDFLNNYSSIMEFYNRK